MWPVLVLAVVVLFVVVAVIIVVGVASAVVIVDVCGSCLHLAAAAHVTANATQHTQHSTRQIQTRKTEASAMAEGRRQSTNETRRQPSGVARPRPRLRPIPTARQAKTQAQSRAYCVRSRSRSRKV